MKLFLICGVAFSVASLITIAYLAFGSFFAVHARSLASSQQWPGDLASHDNQDTGKKRRTAHA